MYGILNCPPSVSSLSRVLMDSAVFPCHMVGMVIAAQGFPSRLLIYPQLVSFKYPTESRYTPGGYLTQHRRDAQASIPRYHVFSPETLCGIRSCSGYSYQTVRDEKRGRERSEGDGRCWRGERAKKKPTGLVGFEITSWHRSTFPHKNMQYHRRWRA